MKVQRTSQGYLTFCGFVLFSETTISDSLTALDDQVVQDHTNQMDELQ